MNVLHGMKVVTLALNLPGPAAARRLMQMGAQVVKVEPPSGDPLETYYPRWYAELAEGQTVLRIDLKKPEGREQLNSLLADADLLISATRPAAMARLGLDPESLRPRFPRLCQVAITGYPAPRENEAGHDLTYQAAMGLVDPLRMPRTLLSDMAGSERTVSAALALLLERERAGRAGDAVVPLSEAAEPFAEPLRYGATVPGASLGGGIPEYNVYPTSDGWLAVAALEPHFKERLEGKLGIRGREEYAVAFAARSCAYWQEWGRVNDVPMETVKS